MNSKKIIGLVAVLAVVITIGVVAQSGQRSPSSSNNKVTVAATFYPLYEFARAVGGDKVNVSNITPAGAEPHDYDPTPRQLVDISEADVLVYNGATMEPWIDEALKEFKQVRVAASRNIDLQAGLDEDGAPGAGLQDPHFWLDPMLAKTIVTNIRDGFIEADPNNKDYYTARANTYTAALEQLDDDFTGGLASCTSRTIVTSHSAFGYFAKRYNVEVLAIAGVSPEDEPSAAKLAELTQLVKSRGITYIFFESLVSSKLAETLAQETGTKTAIFDPIEGMSDDDQQQGKTYISVQRANLAGLRTALGCN